MLRKPFEGLSGHGSSFRRRAKPETEQISPLGKRLHVFETPRCCSNNLFMIRKRMPAVVVQQLIILNKFSK